MQQKLAVAGSRSPHQLITFCFSVSPYNPIQDIKKLKSTKFIKKKPKQKPTTTTKQTKNKREKEKKQVVSKSFPYGSSLEI